MSRSPAAVGDALLVAACCASIAGIAYLGLRAEAAERALAAARRTSHVVGDCRAEWSPTRYTYTVRTEPGSRAATSGAMMGLRIEAGPPSWFSLPPEVQ